MLNAFISDIYLFFCQFSYTWQEVLLYNYIQGSLLNMCLALLAIGDNRPEIKLVWQSNLSGLHECSGQPKSLSENML